MPKAKTGARSKGRRNVGERRHPDPASAGGGMKELMAEMMARCGCPPGRMAKVAGRMGCCAADAPEEKSHE